MNVSMTVSATSSWTVGDVRIRFASFDDLAHVVDMLADPEVARWLWFTPAPPEAFEQFFTPLFDAQDAELADGVMPTNSVFIVEDVDGAFLGEGACVSVAGSPGGCEIGFQLRREAWGRGVGTRLGQFLVAYAVHCRDAYRLEANCLEGNAGSRALLEKLGLVLEGTRPGFRLRDGVRHTELLYGIRVAELDTAAIEEHARTLGLV